MSLVLLLNPSRTINSIKSRTAANRSQLGYQFRREDFTSATNAEDNGSGFLRFGNSSPETNFPVGSQIYVFDDGNYANLGTVTSNTAVASRVDTDIPFNGVQVGSLRINNFTTRPFYRVEIQLKAESGEIFADNIAYEPDPTGEVFVDIQGFLRPRTFFDRFENYSLSYRENWLGNTPGGYVGDEFIQAISANLTLYGRPGANMWDYLLKEVTPLRIPPANAAAAPWSPNAWVDSGDGVNWSVSGNANNSQVLSTLQPGTYSSGFIYAYDILVTASSGGANLYIGAINTGNVGILLLNLGAVSAGDRLTGSITTPSDYIHIGPAVDGSGVGSYSISIELKQIGFKGGEFLTAFANNAKKLFRNWKNSFYILGDLDLIARLSGISTLLYRRNYTDAQDASSVTVETNEGSLVGKTRVLEIPIPASEIVAGKQRFNIRVLRSPSVADVSEQFFMDIQDECVNPVMVEYRNEKGGYDQWLFQFNQTLVESLETSLSWERRIERPWEEIQRTYERGTLERRQTIRVVAENISKQEYYGLAELFTSNEVYVWLNKDGSRKIGAVVRGNPPRVIRTKTRRQNLQVTLAFPNDFNFFQAVEYDLNQGVI